MLPNHIKILYAFFFFCLFSSFPLSQAQLFFSILNVAFKTWRFILNTYTFLGMKAPNTRDYFIFYFLNIFSSYSSVSAVNFVFKAINCILPLISLCTFQLAHSVFYPLNINASFFLRRHLINNLTRKTKNRLENVEGH